VLQNKLLVVTNCSWQKRMLSMINILSAVENGPVKIANIITGLCKNG
jgi:hypothetical protein